MRGNVTLVAAKSVDGGAAELTPRTKPRRGAVRHDNGPDRNQSSNSQRCISTPSRKAHGHRQTAGQNSLYTSTARLYLRSVRTICGM